MLDLLALVYFLYQILLGWRRGFVNMLLRFIINVISLIISIYIFSQLLSLFFENAIFIIVFWLIFWLLKSFIIYGISKITDILHKIPVLSTVNRLLGSLTGALLAFVFTIVMINLLTIFSPFSIEIKTLLDQSLLTSFDLFSK
ncbi:MAG: hypothetical protein GX326_01370 [Clostridiaceae bacterium]|nr:hypothetical protein [Clostridiaceae bacterium]